MRIQWLVVAALCVAAAADGNWTDDHAHDHDHEHGEHCGTFTDVDELREAERIANNLVQRICAQKSLAHVRVCLSWEERVKRPVVVPVHYHVIHGGTRGRLTDEQIQAQFDQTNKDFAGEEDQSIPGWVKMDITFRLGSFTRTDNPTWFNNLRTHEMAAKQLLAVDNTYNFNQYFGGLASGLLGFCYYPHSFPESSFRHGCVNLWNSVPGSPGEYGQGKTTTHETGHGIGLMHTFEGGCNGGDGVEDTCNQASPTRGCPIGRDSCGRGCPDPIHNYLDYSFDRCMTQFTPGQNRRANNQLFTFRPSLYLGEEGVKEILAVLPDAWDEARAFQLTCEKRNLAREAQLGLS